MCSGPSCFGIENGRAIAEGGGGGIETGEEDCGW